MSVERLEAEHIGEDTVQQVLLLAERLREAHGKELDDESIIAVAEATGAPVDYVRIAVANRPKEQAQTVTKKLRGTYLSLDPDERAWVMAAAIGAGSGLIYALDRRFPFSNGLFGILMILFVILGFYTVATRKDSRLATISGAILGATGVIASSVFGLLLQMSSRGAPALIIPVTGACALVGFLLHKTLAPHRKSLGLKDAAEERHDLLRQLVDLQERLKSGEQKLAFMSVDIVGSTRMKANADPLSVEFTFNEFHQFVERVTVKYGGRVHSTAGDGVNSAFDTPQQAFQAAKNLQVGLIELNTFKNRLGAPIVLRCGIHTGSVVTPDMGDVTSLNFAHVIDIADHLQKVCPEGGIVVSADAVAEIPGGAAHVGTEQVESDGVIGFVWRPKIRSSVKESAAPPPFMPEQA